MLLSRWSIWSKINPKERSMCCTKAIVCVYTFLWTCAGQVCCRMGGVTVVLVLFCFQSTWTTKIFQLVDSTEITGAQEPRCDHWGQAESISIISGFRFCIEICREWCEKLQFCLIFAIFRCDKMKPGGLDVFRWTARCCAQLGSDSRCDIEMSHCCTAVFRSKQCRFSKVFVERFFMLKFLGLGFNLHVLLLMKLWLMLRGQWTFRHHKDVIEPEMHCGPLGVLIFLEWGLFGRMWSSQTLTWEKQLLISFDIKKHFVFSSIWVVLLEF